MNQPQTYQLTTITLLLILIVGYLYTINNNTQLNNTIQQLQENTAQQQQQINSYQIDNIKQLETIALFNETLESIYNQLGLNEIQITELNNTVDSKNQLVIVYVQNLVQELYNFQYSRLEMINEIRELEAERDTLKALLEATP